MSHSKVNDNTSSFHTVVSNHYLDMSAALSVCLDHILLLLEDSHDTGLQYLSTVFGWAVLYPSIAHWNMIWCIACLSWIFYVDKFVEFILWRFGAQHKQESGESVMFSGLYMEKEQYLVGCMWIKRGSTVSSKLYVERTWYLVGCMWWEKYILNYMWQEHNIHWAIC